MIIRLPNAKHPLDTERLTWDWNDKLEVGESISTYSITLPAALSVSGQATANGVVQGFVSGGDAEMEYIVTCEITTSAGRIINRSVILVVDNV